MKERLDQNLEQEPLSETDAVLSATRDRYFSNLGLGLEALKDKEILDVGAGQANFAKALNLEGIKVDSVDTIKGGWGHDGKLELPEGLKYFVSGSSEAPFKDFKEASYDLILSRASIPSLSKTKEEVVDIMKEVDRLLKEGGEFHFGPGALSPSIFKDGELFNKDEELSAQDRIRRIAQKSTEFLKGIKLSNGQEIGNNIFKFETNENGRDSLYYVYKKPVTKKE